MLRVDLNCDLGEGAGHDAALMPFLTSANIACGGHAGDAASMRATVGLAQQHQVAVGAHPGFADREHFGRREQSIAPAEVYDLVAGQIWTLLTIVREAGGRLAHVKPHGALYNQAARDPALAQAVAGAVREVDPRLVLVGLAGSRLLSAGRASGLRVASEVFADRTYQADGSLTSRTQPDAFVRDGDAAAARVVTMVKEGFVWAADGSNLRIKADTVCLHGDGPEAVAFARRLREALQAAGIEVHALG